MVARVSSDTFLSLQFKAKHYLEEVDFWRSENHKDDKTEAKTSLGSEATCSQYSCEEGRETLFTSMSTVSGHTASDQQQIVFLKVLFHYFVIQ